MSLTNPFLYVCTVSKFNLPEFEACLLHKPAHIVLIVSTHKDAQQGAEQLTELLKSELPNSQIHQPLTHFDSISLGGDDIAECVAWINLQLKPVIAAIENSVKPNEKPLQRYLNTTGGTKAMLLALITSLEWDKLDYKPMQQQTLQSIVPNLASLPNSKALAQRSDLSLEDTSPLNVAKLYSKSMREDKLNPVVTKNGSNVMAKLIWDALSTPNHIVKHFFQGLNTLWSEQRNMHKEDLITCEWSDFYNTELTKKNDDKTPVHEASPADIFPFLMQLQELSPKAIDYNQTSITLPGNSARKHNKNLKRWVSGDWLEQLVFDWLVSAGIPEKAIARNIQVGDTDNSNSQREADLFIHHNARSSIIEVKADLPPGKDIKDLEQQLSSLGDRFGRTQKVLFIGPLLSQTLVQSNRLESFKLRCKANNVKLCQSQAELIDYFHLNKN